jgi:predicted phage gp36 major capsid-like protein
MDYNGRNDEIRDNITRMRAAWANERQALATVRRFNAANGKAWFWPKIAAALVSKHY